MIPIMIAIMFRDRDASLPVHSFNSFLFKIDFGRLIGRNVHASIYKKGGRI